MTLVDPAPAAPLTARALPTVPVDAIGAAVGAIEAERRLPAGLVAALQQADLFRLSTPTEHGGLELDPVATCAVIEEAAAADGSVGWCVWNGNCGFAAPLLEPGVAEAVYGQGAPVGNSARTGGMAVPEGDGFRLSGRWDLVSGCDHQDWLILFGIVLEGDGPRFVAPGMPDIRAFFVPRREVAVVDKWHVLGLRGTGSNEVVVDGVHVAESFAPAPFAPSRIDRTLYRVPIFTNAAAGGAAVCLGLARGAIADLTELAATKVSIRGPEPIAGQAEVQAAVARADVELRAARAAFHQALAAVTATAEAGAPASLVERGQVRSAMTLAAETSRDVTLRMFQLAGSTAIYDGDPLQRRLRDVLVATQHVMLQPLWYEEAGRILFGLDPTLPVL